MTARGLLAGACLALALAAQARAAQTAERAIDPAHSKAAFSVQHIWVERVTGTVPIVAGTVVLNGGSLVPVSVSATLDPAGLNTGEPDRDAALRSADWFDAAKDPQWTFASTSVAATGPQSFTLDGMLTIHGVAKPEELHVTIGGTPAAPVYHATGTIDRKAFGMSVTRLDPVIGNPVEIVLDVALKPVVPRD